MSSYENELDGSDEKERGEVNEMRGRADKRSVVLRVAKRALSASTLESPENPRMTDDREKLCRQAYSETYHKNGNE
ncbi:hypothetical protein Y032_0254g306 [Ancylostoma ceylanicum]|uniref:Uncharacterized protein n=1 Tax=Ancylostoma ceylanicum TaxID=53326 RepID=A0A016SC95_9BILA|nr:hypothetical protein Y032_0254g306 [Ancylostoma ceylanicum]